MKLISPSNNNLGLGIIPNVKFNKQVVDSFGKYNLFIGNVVHLAYEFYKIHNLTLDEALRHAVYRVAEKRYQTMGKKCIDTLPTKDIINEVKMTVIHNLEWTIETIGHKKQSNEIGMLTKLENGIYLGGTADILIHNDDNSITVADIKNYSKPSQDDLRSHYKQCLLYSKLAMDNGHSVKDIQIIYPFQEQIVTLPNKIELLSS